MRYGSFTEKDDEEASGGPYGQTALREALRGGTVLSLREGPGSFTGQDNEEAYGKAGPLREAPYGEERSLREGPVLTGLGPFIEKNDL